MLGGLALLLVLLLVQVVLVLEVLVQAFLASELAAFFVFLAALTDELLFLVDAYQQLQQFVN